MDDWDHALNSRSAVHMCFIDMAKAFDRVDHVLLLSTLGLSGIELRWFQSCLHLYIKHQRRSESNSVSQACAVSHFAHISSRVPT